VTTVNRPLVIAALGIAGVAGLLLGQAAAPRPAPAKPAAAKPAAAGAKAAAPKVNPAVAEVIQMVKDGTPEALIVKKLQLAGATVLPSADELKLLKQAGVSDNIVMTLMDPKAGAQAAAPAPAAEPAKVAAVPEPAPAAAPAPVAAPAAGAPTAQTVQAQQQKKRVVIDPFKFSAVIKKEDMIFGNATNENIGHGIRSMFITRATQSGKLVIVERGEKEKQLEAEQDFTASNRAKQGSGARIGRIQGADAILAGDIVIFGGESTRTKASGGGIAGGIVGGLMTRNKGEDKFIIAIDYRLIDAETSEIIATGEARGEASRKQKKTGIFGAIGKGAVTGAVGVDISQSSSGFEQTIQGEATMDAINKLAEVLSEQATSMKKRVKEVEASVVDVTGTTVTIGAGEDASVFVGETFTIYKVLSMITDPTTKEVLDKKLSDPLGEMVVSNLRPKVASGTYRGQPVKAGADYLAIKKIPPQN
jgi:curli biogenesis system outer membrane secretion channel CsgG